jgi:photosystem II stability/assembly factor-like uncharacterized protein
VAAVLIAGAAAVCAGIVAGRSADPRAEVHAVKARLAPQSLLLDVAARGRTMIAVGERGHVLVSRDGGGTWLQADVPTRALLTGVFMLDERNGWAVGHDEVVVRTLDGGQTWQRVHEAPEHEKPLLDVWFADARRGLAYGGLLATADGGDTWEPRNVLGDDDFHLNQIAAAADGALYLAAESGHLYRSDDAGATWQALPSPYEGSFFGLLPLSDGGLLAFGLRGHLYRSPDRGATWAQIETGTEESLTSGLELPGGRFAIGGMAGTLLWSQGSGGSVRRQDLADRKAIVALAAGADGRLLTVGEGGVQHIEIPR